MLNSNKNRLFLLGALFAFSTLFSQKGYKYDFGLSTGISNYLGEIGGREKKARPFVLDLKLAKTRWSEGAFFRYRLHRSFAVKLSLNYMRIEGDDKLSIYAPRKYRNLSFRNDIFDLEATGNLIAYDSKKPIGFYNRSSIYFTAYLFAGVGVFYHNPKTLYQGSWVALQPLKTEGRSYSKVGFAVPLGAGFYFTISKRSRAHRIGVEINWRYTNTDYLDDVSSIYRAPSDLSSSTSVALSNRNTEVLIQPDGFSKNYGWQGVDKDGVPLNQAPRGNPKNKDSYISFNISYSTAIKSRYRKSKGRKVRSMYF